MKTSLKSLALVSAMSALGAFHASAAVYISDTNLFTGLTAQTTPEYGPAYAPVYVNDGTPAPFIFTDGGVEAAPRMILSGFSSSIDTIRIFSAGGSRASTSIDIYYGSQLNDPLTNPTVSNAGLTFLGTYALAVDATNTFYTYGTSDDGYQYAQISNLNIPTGTQTIYIGYQLSLGQYGPAVGELQAFAVPEPGTWALGLVAGGVLLVFARRVRRVAA